jgi:rubrerythrin
LAVEHEKDTIIFYQMLQSFIDDHQTSKELEEVIAQEEQHIKLLKECEVAMVSGKR